MHNSHTDSDPGLRVGAEENFIKFRSSPNFKNMKKFLKLKLDCDTTNKEEPEEKQVVEDQSPVIRLEKPPLPRDPPLPVNPILTSPKKEIIEDQYEPSSPSSLEVENPIKIKTELRINQELQSNIVKKKEVPICKNFLRNNCTRPVCIYRHEYDLTVLHGVYKFCKDFQNKKSGCTFPSCKYAHATVFEQERFYKTGYLPPHALAHQKKQNKPPANNNAMYLNGIEKNLLLLPPPPPPPPVLAHENHVQESTAYPVSNNLHVNMLNPPSLNHSVQLGVKGVDPFAGPSVNNNSLSDHIDSNSISKRSWDQIGEFNTPSGQEVNAKRTNKCKHCVLWEDRLRVRKVKLETLAKSATDFNEKFSALDKKHERLLVCFMSLLKPITNHANIAESQGSLGHLYSVLNSLENGVNLTHEQQDKGLTMVEQLKHLIQTNVNRMNFDDAFKAYPLSASAHSNINIPNLATPNNLHNWKGHT